MKLTGVVIVVVMLGSLGGCLIRARTGPGYRECPPAYHWDGYECVHNGRGPVIRDHRRH
jgi:hypothetical protein